MMYQRRNFIKKSGLAIVSAPYIIKDDLRSIFKKKEIITVNGPIDPDKLGLTLSHEHILVDFIGADKYDPKRWDQEEVVKVAEPYIKEIMELGCMTLIDCTPNYIGRDALLLKKLSDQTGINIITNTGYYGASSNKYIPIHAYTETSEQLSTRWIKEFEEGIEDTGIKPGFIKIGVDEGSLSKLHYKLVLAAAFTHLQTGMVIASHTGPAIPAFEQLEILWAQNISPAAFIWIHAQNEKDESQRFKAAEMGAWVSLDGLNDENVEQYEKWINSFKEKNLLNKLLISQDAGWYSPGEPNGGLFRSYATVFNKLIPRLTENGFKNKDIILLFEKNPAEAFTLKVNALK